MLSELPWLNAVDAVEVAPPPAATGALLSASDVVVNFSGLRALDGAGVTVSAGEVHGLVGPNGSGKTTLINCVSGFIARMSGNMVFDGKPLAPGHAASRASMGIGRTFQHPALFGDLSALEHVLIGMQSAPVTHRRDGAIRGSRKAIRDSRIAAAVILDRLGVSPTPQPVSSLPYGQQRLVDIARAVAAAPRLLLLDEPTAGIGQADLVHVRRVITDLSSDGMTILITDHNMRFMLGLCTTMTVMKSGSTLATGVPEEIVSNPAVLEAYLGRSAHRRRPEPTSLVLEAEAELVGDGTDGGDAALEVQGLTAGYTSAAAIRDISFRVRSGEISALVGSNGAGKTTTLKTISGILRTREGASLAFGRRIERMDPSEVLRTGVAHVPEGRGILSGLTVRENLEMGGYTLKNRHLVAERIDAVERLFPILRERSTQKAGSLSGGEQQMLAVGRALIVSPRVLMLDEPSMGLAPVIADKIFDELIRLAAEGMAVLLVEQDSERALTMASSVVVLESGRVRFMGSAERALELGALEQAYMGTAEALREQDSTD